MRACFLQSVAILPSWPLQLRERLGRRHMNDMNGAVIFSAKPDHHVNGFCFPAIRSALHIFLIAGGLLIQVGYSRFAVYLSMNQQGYSIGSQYGHRQLQVFFRCIGEFINARVNKGSTLTPKTPDRQIASIWAALAGTSPRKTNIDLHFSQRGPLFSSRDSTEMVTGLEFSGISTRVVILRLRLTGLPFQTLPICSARFIDMHMRIDRPGHENIIANIQRILLKRFYSLHR